MDNSTVIQGENGGVILEGRFDFDTHMAFKTASFILMDHPGVRCRILDLAQVTFKDSSALGLLLVARHRGELKGIEIVLQNPNPRVTIRRVAQFGRVFQVRSA